MSIKWISYIWDKTDYRDGSALVALALADFANDEGLCHPKMATVAKKARLSVRLVQRIVKLLEGDGFLEVVRKNGRGNQPVFQLKKVTSVTPFRDRERVTSVTVKGDICDTERVTSVTSTLYTEPSTEPSYEPEEDAPENPIALIAEELAIKQTEEAFSIRLDLKTKKLVAAAVPSVIADKWPAYIAGRAVGWHKASDLEKLRRIAYSLTDFQKDNQRFLSNGNNISGYKSERDKQGDRVRQQRAEEDELFAIGYAKREAEARRALSGDSEADDSAHDRPSESIAAR
jgi:hypothetical protein